MYNSKRPTDILKANVMAVVSQSVLIILNVDFP